MQITSSAFSNNKSIPAKHTCDGKNINPPLKFLDVPANAKSLILTITDLDSPSGNFLHWSIKNIDPKTTEIRENSVPQRAMQDKNDFGEASYGGPCPNVGEHRYVFTLKALDESGQALATATLTGKYKRK